MNPFDIFPKQQQNQDKFYIVFENEALADAIVAHKSPYPSVEEAVSEVEFFANDVSYIVVNSDLKVVYSSKDKEQC